MRCNRQALQALDFANLRQAEHNFKPVMPDPLNKKEAPGNSPESPPPLPRIVSGKQVFCPEVHYVAAGDHLRKF